MEHTCFVGGDLLELMISEKEFEQRRGSLIEDLEAEGIVAAVFFGSISIHYLTGFAFIPTERPIAIILAPHTKPVVLVPALEKEHAEETPAIGRVVTYEEYPGPRHPMLVLGDLLCEMGLSDSAIGVDSDGYGGRYGYEGPRLSDVIPNARISNRRAIVEHMRRRKSPQEILLLKETARWSNLAHRMLQDRVAVGRTETEISVLASYEANNAMMRTLGDAYRPGASVFMGVTAGFRGQVGENSALPHAILRNLRLRKGDNLVTYAGATVSGYMTAVERTMFVGEPTNEQSKYFQLMYDAQEIALGAIKPGRLCSDVDKEVRRFFQQNGLNTCWRHHTGHCQGLETHEAPYLDIGSDVLIEPGMVFAVEPGIYIPRLGGFRHQDVVHVTEGGAEMLTYYPRTIGELICEF